MQSEFHVLLIMLRGEHPGIHYINLYPVPICVIFHTRVIDRLLCIQHYRLFHTSFYLVLTKTLQGKPCYPIVTGEDAGSVPFSHMPQGTQLACGRERPRICLPPTALPLRILNTQDPINQGRHFSRGLRTTVVPIAGTQLWLSLPTHRHSLHWKYHLTSCGCYSQLINFCLHNEDKWHSYPFTPKFPSSQAGPVPQRTHNTAGSLFRK